MRAMPSSVSTDQFSDRVLLLFKLTRPDPLLKKAVSIDSSPARASDTTGMNDSSQGYPRSTMFDKQNIDHFVGVLLEKERYL